MTLLLRILLYLSLALGIASAVKWANSSRTNTHLNSSSLSLIYFFIPISAFYDALLIPLSRTGLMNQFENVLVIYDITFPLLCALAIMAPRHKIPLKYLIIASIFFAILGLYGYPSILIPNLYYVGSLASLFITSILILEGIKKPKTSTVLAMLIAISLAQGAISCYNSQDSTYTGFLFEIQTLGAMLISVLIIIRATYILKDARS